MEDETDPRTSVRRVSTVDRKTVLPPAGPLFVAETDDAAQDSAATSAPAATRPPSAARRPTTPPRRPPRRRAKNAVLYNLLTLLFLLLTVAVIAYFGFIWHNVYSPLNLLAPPTPLPIIVTATPGG